MSARDAFMYGLLLLILATLFVWGSDIPKNSFSSPKKPATAENITKEHGSEVMKASESVAVADSQSIENLPPTDMYRVTRVIDGDTFTIDTGKTIRMIGMNTPELYPRDGSTQECFAPEATARTIELIFQKNVRLVRDISDTDRYGRLLRYVYVGDTFVNKKLVVDGFARVRAYKPDTKHHAELLAAMRDAQNMRRGLWGACK